MAAELIRVCGLCFRPIIDRFLLRIMESSYHEKCVRCCICGEALGYTCYVKDSKLYCKLDYDRIYVKKCLGCSERISPEELIMRTSDYIFHLRCFICVVCGLRLQKGDLYVIKQGQLFCRIDYEKEVEMMQGFGHGELLCDDFLPTGRQQDGRRGPKRPRTILTTQQRRAFKASFELSPKPCRKVRETLAKDTGLSVRIVQVWFQNQRAKMKKMEKKARQENKGPRDAESNEKKLVVKEEEQSPRSGYLNDSCSDTENNCETDQSLQQMNSESKSFVGIKHELGIENLYHKHDLHMSFHSGLSLTHELRSKAGNPDEFMGIFESHRRDSLPSQPTSANPIDKLYSMQSSYFCTYHQDEQLDQ